MSKLIAELQQKHLEKCDITAEKVVAEIGKLGFANTMDYIKKQPDGSAFTDLSNLTRDQAAAIQEITTDEYTEGRGEDARDVKRRKINSPTNGAVWNSWGVTSAYLRTSLKSRA